MRKFQNIRKIKLRYATHIAERFQAFCLGRLS